jgi:hypothetical protein
VVNLYLNTFKNTRFRELSNRVEEDIRKSKNLRNRDNYDIFINYFFNNSAELVKGNTRMHTIDILKSNIDKLKAI